MMNTHRHTMITCLGRCMFSWRLIWVNDTHYQHNINSSKSMTQRIHKESASKHMRKHDMNTTNYFVLEHNISNASKTHAGACWTPICWDIMTSSHGSFFRVTGPSRGEFTGHGWIPLIKGQPCGLWCIFDVGPHKVLNTQSNDWWFQTKWRSCDVIVNIQYQIYRVTPTTLDNSNYKWMGKLAFYSYRYIESFLSVG